MSDVVQTVLAVIGGLSVLGGGSVAAAKWLKARRAARHGR